MNSKAKEGASGVTVAGGNQRTDDVLEKYIKISADTIGELRKTDVYRVIASVRSDNIDGVTRGDLATFITAKRSDLVAEVTEVMQEDFPGDGWTVGGKETANPPAVRLWFAMVDHREISGTQSILLAQSAEPSHAEILRRFSSETDTRKLRVTGIFDLSLVLRADEGSRQALEQYLRSASPDAASSQHVSTQKAPSIFDTMVPWGLNRSPIVPAG